MPGCQQAVVAAHSFQGGFQQQAFGFLLGLRGEFHLPGGGIGWKRIECMGYVAAHELVAQQYEKGGCEKAEDGWPMPAA